MVSKENFSSKTKTTGALGDTQKVFLAHFLYIAMSGLSMGRVLQVTTDYDIFKYYLGFEFELRTPYTSPFRDEKNPSFTVFVHESGKLYFKDLGDIYHGDCFQLVQYLYNCNLKEALAIIVRDMRLSIDDEEQININSLKIIERNKVVERSRAWTPMSIVPQSFTIYDKQYWEQYFVSSKTLKKLDIVSTARVYKDRVLEGSYLPNNPIYTMIVNSRFKIYRPYAKPEYKWRNNLTTTDIMGYKQLPDTGEVCLLTKSFKDIACLLESSFFSCSLNSENSVPINGFVEALKRRFGRVVQYYDNDEKGILFAERNAEIYDIDYIHNPIGEPKDYSDYVKEYGLEAGKELLYELLGL